MDNDGFTLVVNKREKNRKRLNKYIWKGLFNRHNKFKKSIYYFNIIYEYLNKINYDLLFKYEKFNEFLYQKYIGTMNYRMYKIYRYMLYLGKVYIFIDHDKIIKFRFYTDYSDYYAGSNRLIQNYVSKKIR